MKTSSAMSVLQVEPTYKGQQTIACEYIWLDAQQRLRSKTRVLGRREDAPLFDVPSWNYDGSSTGQATTEQSEIIIVPRTAILDPFRVLPVSGAPCAYLVICDIYVREPSGALARHKTNTRAECAAVLEKHKAEEPMFGFEQEFFMIDISTGLPLGFKSDGTTEAQGRYYCGVGAGSVFGRNLVEEVVGKALRIGLPITGANFEVAPGQAEIQLCSTGLDAPDQLIILRYLLQRAGEAHGIEVSFEPKPVKGDWNGTGCHINFSTKTMRRVSKNPKDVEESQKAIDDAVERLSRSHHRHVHNYGKGNDQRLTGKHETSSMDEFSAGVANRSASVRIPSETHANGYGYIEDRRPGGNVDPYVACRLLVDTICGGGK